MCSCQCHDTSATMSDKYNGAQPNLGEILNWSIPYITCWGHKSNLCVKHGSKESVMIEKFFTTMHSLYNFLTKSTSRFGQFKEKIEELKEGLSMKNICDKMDWLNRVHESCMKFLQFPSACIRHTKDEDENASNFLMDIKSVGFYIRLVLMNNILYKMKGLTLKIQEIQKDVVSAVESMKVVNQELNLIRNNESDIGIVIQIGENNAKMKGVNLMYEFDKDNRLKLLRLLDGQSDGNREKVIRDYFMLRHRKT